MASNLSLPPSSYGRMAACTSASIALRRSGGIRCSKAGREPIRPAHIPDSSSAVPNQVQSGRFNSSPRESSRAECSRPKTLPSSRKREQIRRVRTPAQLNYRQNRGGSSLGAYLGTEPGPIRVREREARRARNRDLGALLADGSRRRPFRFFRV
jgi:hypothetical protein